MNYIVTIYIIIIIFSKDIKTAINTDQLQKLNNKVSSKKHDLYMTCSENDRLFKSLPTQDTIYLSLNETNEYKSPTFFVDFSLHRIKINFIVYYKRNDSHHPSSHLPYQAIHFWF